jgi:hypothetical protein
VVAFRRGFGAALPHHDGEEQGPAEHDERREQDPARNRKRSLLDGATRAEIAGQLRDESLRPRSGCSDVEDEPSFDGMRVRRHDPVGRCVSAVGKVGSQRHRDTVRGSVRVLCRSRVDAVAVAAVDAQRSKGKLHGLTEADFDARRRALDDLVDCGARLDDERVRLGRARRQEDEKKGCQAGGF